MAASWLFTAGKGSPSLLQEIRKELASADQVDSDTACGFAVVTVVGSGVLAAHFSVNCLRPAKGEYFIARARVVRAGRTQVFTACELFAVSSHEEKPVATGKTLLSVSKVAE